MPCAFGDELTDTERTAVLDGAAAVRRLLASPYDPQFANYLAVGRGLAALRRLAETRRSRAATFKYFTRAYGYAGLVPATISRLLLIAQHEAAVVAWRNALPEPDRLNSPSEIVRLCPALREAIANGRWTKDRTEGARIARRKLDKQRASLMRLPWWGAPTPPPRPARNNAWATAPPLGTKAQIAKSPSEERWRLSRGFVGAFPLNAQEPARKALRQNRVAVITQAHDCHRTAGE